MLVHIDTDGLHVTSQATVHLAAMVLQHPAFRSVLSELPADVGTWAALARSLFADGERSHMLWQRQLPPFLHTSVYRHVCLSSACSHRELASCRRRHRLVAALNCPSTGQSHFGGGQQR